MTEKPTYQMSISELASAVRARKLSPILILEMFLDRIQQLDESIGAWVSVDHAGAMEAARKLTVEAEKGQVRSELHGIPIGVKDVFDVAGMVTTSGAGPFAHVSAQNDAYTVALLRNAGAIILGKTVTTQFALTDPAETRNPWNFEHTPGGSSSGSAAAVSAHMVPAALGTQSLGSVLRPAAYCGIVGFKPTHGRISFRGVMPVAPSVDHVGLLTKSVADASLLFATMAGYDVHDPLSVDMPAGLQESRKNAPRLGIAREFLGASAHDTVSNLKAVAETLAKAGAHVEEVTLPSSFQTMFPRGREVMLAELAAHHEAMFKTHASQYKPRVRQAIEEGARLSATDLVRAQSHCALFRRQISPMFEQYDVLLTPACPAPAPKGLSSTGDGSFCAPWTFAGFPAIGIPSGLSSDGLPLAIQLVARHWADAELLAIAAWCEHLLPSVVCQI